MSPKRHFLLKNSMLLATVVITTLAVGLLKALNYISMTRSLTPDVIMGKIHMDVVGDMSVLILAVILLYIYELPMRRCLNLKVRGVEPPEKMMAKAKRRILNEPFFVGRMFLIFWLAGSVIYASIALELGMSWFWVRLYLADAFHTFVIAMTLVFAFMVMMLQRLYAPYFFPHGGQSSVPGAKTVPLRSRLVVLLLALNVLPLMGIIRTQYKVIYSGLPVDQQFELLTHALWFIAPFSVFVGIVLVLLAGGSTTRSLNDLVSVLNQIARGDFKARVQVTSNDEIGYAGDIINKMTAGLRERDRLRKSLDLAREVQQNLIPKTVPSINGLEMAGKSIYCEETGGDYYDYLNIGANGGLGVVVGDVSDHGIQSALLMASARAFLRQRSYMSGTISDIVSDVNRQVTIDVEESGQFMTLFYCRIDREKGLVAWANAGHDPALVYDPVKDEFFELAGHGLPMGIFEDTKYTEFQKEIQAGRIIVLATDGIWETRNAGGEMFGKERFRQAIRANFDLPADEILDQVIKTVYEFSGPRRREDDMTLVIVKVV